MPPRILDTINDTRVMVDFVDKHWQLIRALAERLPPDFAFDIDSLDDLLGELYVGPAGSLRCGLPPDQGPNQPVWNECSYIPLTVGPGAFTAADLRRFVDRALSCCEALRQVFAEPPPPPID